MLSGVRAAGTGGSEPRGRLWLERVRLLVRWGAEARDAVRDDAPRARRERSERGESRNS